MTYETAYDVWTSLMQVDCFSSVRVYIQKDLRKLEARQAGMKSVALAVSRLCMASGQVPSLDLAEDMKARPHIAGLCVCGCAEGVWRRQACRCSHAHKDDHCSSAWLDEQQAVIKACLPNTRRSRTAHPPSLPESSSTQKTA
eukprot:356619-Chlamydomonas_euryale.AAC.1